MSAMGTSCITTVTAFAVVNAQRLGMNTFDLEIWAAPIVVLGIGLGLWRRSYAKRFGGTAVHQASAFPREKGAKSEQPFT
jgi:cytochrome c-type biogenesis protein CcmH/NrfF